MERSPLFKDMSARGYYELICAGRRQLSEHVQQYTTRDLARCAKTFLAPNGSEEYFTEPRTATERATKALDGVKEWALLATPEIAQELPSHLSRVRVYRALTAYPLQEAVRVLDGTPSEVVYFTHKLFRNLPSLLGVKDGIVQRNCGDIAIYVREFCASWHDRTMRASQTKNGLLRAYLFDAKDDLELYTTFRKNAQATDVLHSLDRAVSERMSEEEVAPEVEEKLNELTAAIIKRTVDAGDSPLLCSLLNDMDRVLSQQGRSLEGICRTIDRCMARAPRSEYAEEMACAQSVITLLPNNGALVREHIQHLDCLPQLAGHTKDEAYLLALRLFRKEPELIDKIYIPLAKMLASQRNPPEKGYVAFAVHAAAYLRHNSSGADCLVGMEDIDLQVKKEMLGLFTKSTGSTLLQPEYVAHVRKHVLAFSTVREQLAFLGAEADWLEEEVFKQEKKKFGLGE